MKKILILWMIIFSLFYISGCKNNNTDNFEWDNQHAIYVTINIINSKKALKNIEEIFTGYNFEKIYVVEKELYENDKLRLKLLIIVESDMDLFVSKLKGDQKVLYYEVCKDLEYESIDNRFLEYDKDVIKVGETLNIKLSGNSDLYMQPFVFDSFYITLENYNKEKDYTSNDFFKVKNIESIIKGNEKLLVTLKNSDYYELIRTIDKFAREDYIQNVSLNYICVIPSDWEISNGELIDIMRNSDNSITIVGLNSGIVNIKYEHLECNIIIE